MVIFNRKPNLNVVNTTNKKLVRLPEGLDTLLTAEEKRQYHRLSMEDKDQFLRGLLPDYLQSKGVDLTRPFTCPNPTHLDRHPSTSYSIEYPTTIKCWSCDESFSIFDIVYFDYFYEDGSPSFMADDELPNVKRKTEELFGLRSVLPSEAPVESPVAPEPAPVNNTEEEPIDPKLERVADRVVAIEPVDIHTLHREVNLPYYGSHSTCVAKWATRGISEDMVDKFNLGYSPATDGLVVPTITSHFIRFLHPADPKHKGDRPKGVASYPFNCECLLKDSEEPIFITEGEIDALSILQEGHRAIALGGLAYSGLVAVIKGLSKEQQARLRLVVALDNDDTGHREDTKILTALKTLGIKATVLDNLYGSCKDANEFLMKDESGFKAILGLAVKQANEAFAVEEQKEEAEKATYINDNSMLSFMDTLSTSLTDPNAHPTLSTGIQPIDDALGGGLKNELYVVGACSSLGKTTLCHQVADNIAQRGQHVLFYSLEMSREALVYKSLTRQSALSKAPVLTEGTLSMGDLYRWSKTPHLPDEQSRLCNVISAYQNNIAPSMFIFESAGTLTVADIRSQVEKHKEITGQTPILFIDYLQIVGSADDRWDVRKTVDYNVSELKRISRDFNTPVILISSLNRASYTEKISMPAFKESGSIEYGCDVLIGLQLSGVAELNAGTAGGKKIVNALDEAVTANKIAGKDLLIDFRLLKNRSGATSSTRLAFNSRAGYFHSNVNVREWVKDVWVKTPSTLSRTYGAGADWLESMLGPYDHTFGLELDGLFRFQESEEMPSIWDKNDNQLTQEKQGYIQDGQLFELPED